MANLFQICCFCFAFSIGVYGGAIASSSEQTTSRQRTDGLTIEILRTELRQSQETSLNAIVNANKSLWVFCTIVVSVVLLVVVVLGFFVCFFFFFALHFCRSPVACAGKNLPVFCFVLFCLFVCFYEQIPSPWTSAFWNFLICVIRVRLCCGEHNNDNNN